MKNYLLSALMVTSFSASMQAQTDVSKIVTLGVELAAAGCALVAIPELLEKCLQIDEVPIPTFTNFFKAKTKVGKVNKTRMSNIPIVLVWSYATYYLISNLKKRAKDLKKINIKK